MKELSLNILDIAKNSVKAGATLTEIRLLETDTVLTLTIKDNGCGMPEEIVKSVSDPFYTTRTTRAVGLGIPLLKMAAEQTGGRIEIFSRVDDGKAPDHGTVITAHFYKNHIDFTPLGDAAASFITLIQGHPEVDFLYSHTKNGATVLLDTREIRQVLDGIPLDTYEILEWIRNNIDEQYSDLFT